MQQSSSHMVKVGILIGVLGLCLVLAPLGCSSEPENPEWDPCDGPGVRNCFATRIAEMPDIKPVGVDHTPHVTLDEVRAGIRLVLSYDSTTNAFTGLLENTTETLLPKVGVAVYLDPHATRLMSSATDLAPSQVIAVTLPVDSKPFTSWSVDLVFH